MKISICILPLAFLVFLSCNPDTGSEKDARQMNAADWNDGIPVITADVETNSRYIDGIDDTADDVAIWIHPEDSSRSVIIGTNKTRGVSVYNLQGREVQFVEAGQVNNVDVRYGFRTGPDAAIDIVGFSERGRNEIVLMGMQPNGRLKDLPGGHIASDLSEVYGFCLYQSRLSEALYAFVNDKLGNIEQWHIRNGGTFIAVELVRRLKLDSQLEGMVADDTFGVLYVGEEDKGIWRFNAEPDGPPSGKFVAKSDESNENIAYDIEGLALYPTSSTEGYLIASSQGNNSYAVFSRNGDNRYLQSFRIAGGGFDDTRDTDGLDATAVDLGPRYPKGILVVQDGINYRADTLSPQNYKIVDFRKVIGVINKN